MSKHVFISYQHEDGEFADNLIYQVEKNGFLTWIDSDGLIAGTPWREGIDQAIRDSFALIVIMSPAAKVSEYVTYEWAFAWGCGIKVIPIMYRKTELHPRLESLQYMDFTNRNHRPWNDLMWVLREAAAPYEPSPDSIATIPGPSPKKQARLWIEKGEMFLERHDYQEALDAFRQAILLDPNNAQAYSCKSEALYMLKKYQDVLVASQQAINLDASLIRAWYYKGMALDSLKKFEEALITYNEASRIAPDSAAVLCRKGYVLNNLKRYEEALQACNQAIHLGADNAFTWNNKGYALNGLKRYKEALSAYEQALLLEPDNPDISDIWHNKGDTLRELGRHQEAEEYYRKARIAQAGRTPRPRRSSQKARNLNNKYQDNSHHA